MQQPTLCMERSLTVLSFGPGCFDVLFTCDAVKSGSITAAPHCACIQYSFADLLPRVLQ